MLASLYDRKAFPETKIVLEQLREKYTLVIASNTDTEPLEQNLRYNKMFFEHVYTSEMLRCYKPDARFYTQIMEKLHCDASEVLFVGDSGAEDIAAPKRLGMRTVLIDRKQTGADFGQDHTLRDLSGLRGLL